MIQPPIFALPNRKREYSSAGLEHLPYKQRVLGSNPSTPTKSHLDKVAFFVQYPPYNGNLTNGYSFIKAAFIPIQFLHCYT